MLDIFGLAKKYMREQDGDGILNLIVAEILHYEILDELYKDTEIKNMLVFQGGTALRLFYGGIRYSEDLDFCITEEREFELELIEKFIQTLKKSIKQKFDIDIEIKYKQKLINNVEKWEIKFYSHYGKNNQMKRKHLIKLEIAKKIKSFDNSEIHIASRFKENYLNIVSRVESLEEILTGKIVALAFRPEIKFRDLWDIKFLADNNVKLDMNLLFMKNENYSHNIDELKNSLKERLVIIDTAESKNKFYAEMSLFLEQKDFSMFMKSDFFESVKKAIIRLGKDIIEHIDNINRLNDTSSMDRLRDEFSQTSQNVNETYIPMKSEYERFHSAVWNDLEKNHNIKSESIDNEKRTEIEAKINEFLENSFDLDRVEFMEKSNEFVDDLARELNINKPKGPRQ